MEVVLIILVTLAGSVLAFGLFVGTDELVARLRQRPAPAFDWWERGAWDGRSTPAKAATRLVALVLATLAWLAISIFVLGLAMGLVGLGLQRLLT